jgi:chitinase
MLISEPGEILDIAEIAATPALIQECVKGVEKEGKAEFKVFGKEHSLTMDKPTTKPTASRPPESSHMSAKTSSDSDSCPQQPKFMKRAGDRPCRKKRVVTTTNIVDGYSARPSVARCDGFGNAKQACLHYSSVINANPGFGTITCPYTRPPITSRPAVDEYEDDRPRDVGWTAKIPDDCQRDEYPPALCLQTNDGYKMLDGHNPARVNTDVQYIRLIVGSDNGAAGQIWKCPKGAEHHDVEGESHEEIKGGIKTIWQSVSAVYTRKLIEVVPNVPAAVDAGLGDNKCQPKRPNIDDRGYALLNRDPWFLANPMAAALTPQYLKAPTGFNKRDLLDPNEIAISDGNSSRYLTDEELQRDFGIIKCSGKDCTEELAELGIESIIVDYKTPPSSPATAVATSTTLSAVATEDAQSSAGPGSATSSFFPRPTQK